jgi:hydrogenase/urease accessory protein HupE
LKRAFAVAVGLVVLLVAAAAAAHAMGVSSGEYRVSGAEVEVTLVFRADELAAPRTPERVVSDLVLEADGARCAGTLDRTAADPPDGLRIAATYACGHPPRRLHIHAGFLAWLPARHAHVATVVDSSGRRSEHLAVIAQPDVDVDLTRAPSVGFWGFVRAGILHILTGPDHLLFLLGLVLLPREIEGSRRERVRALVFVLTAFTLGHSVSLAIATLGGLAPGARVVEPLVALSVAYIGAENLFGTTRRVQRRALVTLPFGLVHGFAFASGLLLVYLPRPELPLALVGFNMGVELGQLGVLALVLPVLLLLARSPRAYDRARVGLSIGVLGCGLVWFVQRLL